MNSKKPGTIVYYKGKQGKLVYEFSNGGARIEPQGGGPWDWANKGDWSTKKPNNRTK